MKRLSAASPTTSLSATFAPTFDIQPLRQQVERYLAEIDWEQWQQEQDPYTEIDNAAYKQAIDSARRMKIKGYPAAAIADITGLTAEEIDKL